jgi:hypothetical protein
MNMSNIYVSLPNLFFYFLSPSLFSHFFYVNITAMKSFMRYFLPYIYYLEN